VIGAEWADPLLRGLAALGGAALIFSAARVRFARREHSDEAPDNGLD
jgi:hypothetical protein